MRDSMRCLYLLAENPPEPGKVRIVNQYDQVYSILELAESVRKIAKEFGIAAKIEHLDNPRWEMERHFYEMEREKLVRLGYETNGNLEQEIYEMFRDLMSHRHSLKDFERVIAPTVRWHRDS